MQIQTCSQSNNISAERDNAQMMHCLWSRSRKGHQFQECLELQSILAWKCGQMTRWARKPIWWDKSSVWTKSPHTFGDYDSSDPTPPWAFCTGPQCRWRCWLRVLKKPFLRRCRRLLGLKMISENWKTKHKTRKYSARRMNCNLHCVKNYTMRRSRRS